MSNHKHSRFSSWKNLFLQQDDLLAQQAYPSDVDYSVWQSALHMSENILDAFGSVLPYSKENETRNSFKNVCYQWLLNKPEIKFGEEENLAGFNQFNFNAAGDKNPVAKIQVFRTVKNQLVCSIPERLHVMQKLPRETKGIIVNAASVSYDMWMKKITHQHRMEHMVHTNCDSNNISHFLMPVKTGEHILTLTAVTYSFWCVKSGWLCVMPGRQWKPSFIAGSTYN